MASAAFTQAQSTTAPKAHNWATAIHSYLFSWFQGIKTSIAVLWQQPLSGNIILEPQKIFIVTGSIKNVSHILGYLFLIRNKTEDTSQTRQLNRKTQTGNSTTYFYTVMQVQIRITKYAMRKLYLI